MGPVAPWGPWCQKTHFLVGLDLRLPGNAVWYIPGIYWNIPETYWNIPGTYMEAPNWKLFPSQTDPGSLYLQNRFPRKETRSELVIKRNDRFL